MSQKIALIALDFGGKARMSVGMTKPPDRSATKALLKQELKDIHRRLRKAQNLVEANELEQAVAAAGEIAELAWQVAHILVAEELLHRFTKT
ncbi:MAG: hypothetical protein RO009_01655 [Pseudorhodoplanes sp.]|jgi:VIT1/CCC1 family predicted Fe2+/Mn2+ transporter|nr:hypothetical protein [Pseudorhodoplanes sp.]